MAQLDPLALLARAAEPSSRFKLRLHGIKPEQLAPNGDRYVVEEVDIDDFAMGSLLIVTQDALTESEEEKGPMAKSSVERRGVFAAVVVRGGNGHLLGLPDHAVVVKDKVQRPPADVPMPYAPGDLLLIDKNAKGRAIKMYGRDVRICNQIDVLLHVEGVKLRRTADGGWEEVTA